MAEAAPIATHAAPRVARAGIAVPGLIFGILAALPAAAVVAPENYLLALGTRIMIFAIAAVALFWCYLLQSRTTAVNSDAAGMVLPGWDMMHGNVLLRGWLVADVSFSTFEIPVDGLVAVIHGLGPDVAHISAAIVYTLLVLSAAMLARGTARGAEDVRFILVKAREQY